MTCVLGHPEPVESFVGHACRRHYHWISATLREIEELFALTGCVLIPGPGGDGRGATRVDSPAPGRIEVMALTDPRAVARHDLPDDDIPDLPGSLASWADRVVEEMRLEVELDGAVSGSVRLLRRERRWIARQEWLDDYVADLAGLHRAVASAVGASMWPRPIGCCPNCGAPMYPTIGVDVASCRRCKSSWSGVALARLRLIHEQEGA